MEKLEIKTDAYEVAKNWWRAAGWALGFLLVPMFYLLGITRNGKEMLPLFLAWSAAAVAFMFALVREFEFSSESIIMGSEIIHEKRHFLKKTRETYRSADIKGMEVKHELMWRWGLRLPRQMPAHKFCILFKNGREASFNTVSLLSAPAASAIGGIYRLPDKKEWLDPKKEKFMREVAKSSGAKFIVG